jgi:hypothetical protein
MKTFALSLTALLASAGCASKQTPPPAAVHVLADPVAAATAPPGTLPPATAVPAVQPAPPLAPRTAEVILADVVKAVGGDAAWNAHSTMRMKLEMSFQGMGIGGSGERFATKSDKALVVTELPGIGTIREGTNGQVFWSQDPVNGLRLLSGAEAEQARVESVWNLEQRTKELYKTIEVKSEDGPGGARLECLVLTPKEGAVVTNCYDPKTHLQVLQKGSRSTPQGDTPFISVLKDWREVGGIKMAYAVDTQAGPITFTARITDVKFDEPMDDKMFEAPAAAAAPAKPGKAKTRPKAKAKAKAKP